MGDAQEEDQNEGGGDGEHFEEMRETAGKLENIEEMFNILPITWE